MYFLTDCSLHIRRDSYSKIYYFSIQYDTVRYTYANAMYGHSKVWICFSFSFRCFLQMLLNDDRSNLSIPLLINLYKVVNFVQYICYSILDI